jgi:hypothetical protein
MTADPALLESIAFFGAAALGLGIAAIAGLSLWRALADARRLLLAEVLMLEGVDLAQRVKGAGGREFALAARRCMECAARERCAEWLAERRGEGYQGFCPNARYIDALRHR